MRQRDLTKTTYAKTPVQSCPIDLRDGFFKTRNWSITQNSASQVRCGTDDLDDFPEDMLAILCGGRASKTPQISEQVGGVHGLIHGERAPTS